MKTSIEKILAELVNLTSSHFDLDAQDALAVVAESKIANDVSSGKYHGSVSIDKLADELFQEISMAK